MPFLLPLFLGEGGGRGLEDVYDQSRTEWRLPSGRERKSLDAVSKPSCNIDCLISGKNQKNTFKNTICVSSFHSNLKSSVHNL